MKKVIIFIVIVLVGIGIYFILRNDKEEEVFMDREVSNGENKLYYLGHASLRIVTREGKVIYIDPYMGNDYDMSADLVLVTHDHYDHNEVSKVKNREDDFKLITEKDALLDGEYQTFDLGYVKVEAVEAGYNTYHHKDECVGYVITLSDGTKIYIAGDTALTPQMDELGSWNIDYAFFPCDGKYTMSIEDAILASKKVKARYSIPYHVVSDGRDFDESVANKFDVDGKLIIKPREEIVLGKSEE